MTGAVPLRISAILAVHNEEALIRGCLTALASVADEILVAHDGPCTDRSLQIAREFTPHVWVHERRGAPESHLIRLLRRATNEWIVRLDCDEAFAPGLVAALQAIKRDGGDPGITHYTAIWRAVYSPADHGSAREHEIADRTVLFRRSCTRWIGIPHSPAMISGSARGLRDCVYHYAPHQQYGLAELLSRKLLPFAKADAAIRMKYPIEAIGYDGKGLAQILNGRERWRLARPLLGGGALAAIAGLGALRRAFAAGSPVEFVRNLRWPVANLVYQLALAWEIHRLRHRGYSPRLASEST